MAGFASYLAHTRYPPETPRWVSPENIHQDIIAVPHCILYLWYLISQFCHMTKFDICPLMMKTFECFPHIIRFVRREFFSRWWKKHSIKVSSMGRCAMQIGYDLINCLKNEPIKNLFCQFWAVEKKIKIKTLTYFKIDWWDRKDIIQEV